MSKLDNFFSKQNEIKRQQTSSSLRRENKSEDRREFMEFKIRQYRPVFEFIERNLLLAKRKLHSNGIYCEMIPLKLNDPELHLPVEHHFALAGFTRKSATSALPFISPSTYMKYPNIQIRVNVEKDSVYVMINDLKSEEVRRLPDPNDVTEEAVEEYVLKILQSVL